MTAHHRLFAIIVICTCATRTTAQEQSPEPQFDSEQIAFFEKDVLPILQKRCFECHGGEPKVRGGLRLTRRADILEGGELGPAALLDEPEESNIVDAIRYGSLEMPPDGRLPEEEVQTLVRWIKLGLPWSSQADYGVEPAHEEGVTGDGRDYWAYQTIHRPAPPPVKNLDWSHNAIDRFICRDIEKAGLNPSGLANPVALVRRAYYDLTGLPPTPEQVDQFVKDPSPQAWSRLLDALLDSPQYGEKWGRHWLDLVRFAETHGYERDSPKPHAWRYRDYVIASFNEDKPYDQFLIEQIAGDELESVSRDSITATGFYRLGLWDDEPADRLLARYDGLDDMVKTASEVFLGMSMGCARCHSHKGDPIKHHEYYSFLAYFHNVTYPGNLRQWVTDLDRTKHDEQVLAKKEAEEEMAAEIQSLETKFRAGLQKQRGIKILNESEVKEQVIFADSREQPQAWQYTTEKPSDDWMQSDYSTTSWDKGPGGFGTRGTPGSRVRTEWSSRDIWLRKTFQLQQIPPFLALELHHDEDCEVYLNGTLVLKKNGYVTKYLRVPLDQKAIDALQPGRNVLAIHCHQTGGGQYIDAGLVIAPSRVNLVDSFNQYGPEVVGKEGFQRWRDLRKRLEESRRRKIQPVGTPIMSVSEAGQPPVHVLIRGNPHARGDQVGPAVPAMLGTTSPAIPQNSFQPGTAGRRLALAQWMVAPENPLTARVFANRLWQFHFGRGIVPTPNDFGKLGERPTHPELLDWLASELVEGGWKIKRMHKLIMTSKTYQQSSASQPQAMQKDPSNQLFWRFNMRRLSAEELRDSIIAATGNLSLKAGGPGIYVSLPAEVLAGQSRPGAGWGNSPATEQDRRSVYIHVKRSLRVPILEMHDSADTDSSCPVRYVTTVPTQTLGMLNGDFTNKQAVRLAERLTQEAPADVAAQVRLAIRLTTSRHPEEDEVNDDVAFIKQLIDQENLTVEKALQVYCLLVINANEFVYLD